MRYKLASQFHSILAIAFVFAILSSHCLADDTDTWSQFHGNDGKGLVAGGAIPDKWNEDDYAWRVDLGSRDVGSPVVADNKVFLLTSLPQDR